MRKQYTKEEDDIILKYVPMKHGEKLAFKELSAYGRTYASVHCRRNRLLGVRKSSKGDKELYKKTNAYIKEKIALTKNAKNNYKPWTTKEINFILTSKLSRLDQAKELDRSWSSITNMITKLNRKSK